ncbi:MAG: BatA domain-containing protein [Planctomycetota bacterium]
MSFLRPELLPWLSALLVVPLLYLARRRARRVVVPHLFLWERVRIREGRVKARRIRDLLGILFQMLIGAALILAWAGPQREDELVEAPRILALLDVSAPMARRDEDGRTAFERARARLRGELEGLAARGEVGLVLVGEGLRTVSAPGPDREAIRAALDAIVPDLAGRLDREGLDRWVAARLAEGRPTEIRLYSVGAEGEAAPPGVLWVPIEGPTMNAAITRVELGPGAEGEATVRVGLRALGGRFEGHFLLRDETGEILHDGAVSLDDGDTVELGAPAPPPGTWVRAEIERDEGRPDAMAFDDAVDLRVAPRAALRCAVVAKDAPPRLLDALLVCDDLIDARAAVRLPPESWRPSAAEYDVVVLCGVEEARPLPPGRYLLVDSTAPGLGLAFEGRDRDVGILRQGGQGPVLRGLDLRNLRLSEARRVAVRPDGRRAGVRAILEGTTGALVSAGEIDGVSFVQLAFGLEEERSSFALLPAFPLFVNDVFEHLGRERRRLLPPVLAAGRSFPLPVDRGRPAARPAVAGAEGAEGAEGERPAPTEGEPRAPSEVQRPAPAAGELPAPAEASFVPLEAAGDAGRWRAPDPAGRWELAIGDRRELVGVARFDEALSDATRVWPAPATTPAPPEPLRHPRQRDLTWIFLAAALGVLLLEWWTYHRGWST